jgi:hypothetical protein
MQIWRRGNRRGKRTARETGRFKRFGKSKKEVNQEPTGEEAMVDQSVEFFDRSL